MANIPIVILVCLALGILTLVLLVRTSKRREAAAPARFIAELESADPLLDRNALLARWARNSNETIRFAALRLLSDRQPDHHRDAAFERALLDMNPEVRALATRVLLTRAGQVSPFGQLMIGLRHPDEQVRFSAVVALADSYGLIAGSRGRNLRSSVDVDFHRTVAALRVAAADSSNAVRAAAESVLGDLGYEVKSRNSEDEQLGSFLPFPMLPGIGGDTGGDEGRVGKETLSTLFRPWSPDVVRPFLDHEGELALKARELAAGARRDRTESEGMTTADPQLIPTVVARREPTYGSAPDTGSGQPGVPAMRTQIAAAREVCCSAFSHREIRRGETLLVQAYIHPIEDSLGACRLAESVDPGTAQRAVKSLALNVVAGTKLCFMLEIPGMDVPDSEQSFTWRERTEGVTFAARVPGRFAPQSVVATLIVAVEQVPVGRIHFRVSIVRRLRRKPDRSLVPAGEDARHYARAFISYATEDRSKVIQRMQMLTALGIRFFHDLLSLEPGERWEHRLWSEIDASDLFLLFWSKSARESKWVHQEVRYAVERQQRDPAGLPDIRPIMLEGTPVPPPFPELAHLHFNDKLLNFIPAAGTKP